MEFSILPKKYGEDLTRDGIEGIANDYFDKLFIEIKEDNVDFKVEEVNYGSGADWIWLLVSIYGTYKLIIEGDKIDKGLSGWKNIFKKVKKLLKKSNAVKLDSELLLLFAAEEVFNKYKKTNYLVLIQKTEIKLPLSEGSTDFDRITSLYSLFVFESENECFVVGVKINGEAEIVKIISAP